MALRQITGNGIGNLKAALQSSLDDAAPRGQCGTGLVITPQKVFKLLFYFLR
jgi:hypothetical protein